MNNANSELSNWITHAKALEQEVQFLAQKNHLLETKLLQIKNRPSWKLAKPLRVLDKIQNRFSNAVTLRAENFELIGKTILDDQDLVLRKISRPSSLNWSKVAYFAHFDENDEFSENDSRIVDSLMKSGFNVILISAINNQDEFANNEKVPQDIIKIRKLNLGYDFGSWAVGYYLYPPKNETQEVLFLNNSVIGLLNSVDELINKCRKSVFELTGITDSMQHGYHVQSYFWHLKKQAFNSEEFKKFISSIRHFDEKELVIKNYELGLSQRLQNAGLKVGAIYSWNSFSNSYSNISIEYALELVEKGNPFIKVEAFNKMNDKHKNQILQKIS